ncbi:isoaspartyl peptidase/L-asparaginase family protein [Pontibacter beigongshangensis]|uniref:isoaspartyl peptidase/L-asparaginase family protein n=1 Tax=Pontibacter beigongshangensis TaxID=2574733 RepID=UPI00164FEE11|nr:isoaspartyl peptidase/L-asparaginase [Pontibacter beigongshangensis]
MNNFVIVIHAGAEKVKPGELPAEKEKAYRKALSQALQAGWEILRAGGSAVDAVAAAVQCMENEPLFNAGKGGSLTQRGETEFDAAIMDGRTLKAGAVGGIRFVQNPISLAKVVMEKCKHIFISGTGAEEYALRYDLPFKTPDYFITDEKRKAWLEKLQESETTEGHDTVGAVALDQEGNLAVATSTGGLTNQQKGRIGDSPVIGGGTFADNEVCAVSCTGEGEVIMRGVLAHEVYALVKYAGNSLQQAAEKTIRLHNNKLQGDKGLIALSPAGEVAIAFNTGFMKRAYRIGSQEPVVALWEEE